MNGKKKDNRMKSWAYFIFILCFLLGGFPLQAAVETSQDAPKAFIEDMGKLGIDILSDRTKTRLEREEDFREILHEFFDVKSIAKFVLGRYWHELAESDKSEYLRLFENEIARSYAVRFENYKGEKFHVLKSKSQGENEGWSVSSEIERPEGQTIAVNWIVYQTPQGLRVFDVVVEGVSMSATKRSEYAAIISKKGGVEGLLKTLQQQYP